MQQPGGDAIAAYGLGSFYFDKKRHEDAIAAWEQSREIVNRFSRELLILQPIQTSDYRDMLASIAPKVPPYLRETFLRIGHEKINEAMVMQQGCRFIEDILLQTILSERTSLLMLPQKIGRSTGKAIAPKGRKTSRSERPFLLMGIPILHCTNSESLPLEEAKDRPETLHNAFRISFLSLWSIVAWLVAGLLFESLLEMSGRAEAAFDGDFGV